MNENLENSDSVSLEEAGSISRLHNAALFLSLTSVNSNSTIIFSFSNSAQSSSATLSALKNKQIFGLEKILIDL